MNTICEIKNQPAMSVLAVRTRCAVAELPRVLGEAYAKIESYLVEVGGQPVYAPFVVYYNMDMDALDIDAGIPVAGGLSGMGEIQAHEWPAGRVLSSVYTCAYEGMPEAYAQIDAWAEANGVRRQGIVYEFYHNDPAITPPGQLVTEIVFPLV